ncbi:MAG: triose-phosphate isomerase [Planctomycetota bacterium]
MSRQIIIAGNWKLNLTTDAGVDLVRILAQDLTSQNSDREVIVFPTALGLQAAAKAAAGSPIAVGVQNVHGKQSGAFTGENSPELAKAAGASWVLLGHSERRQYFGETDDGINAKIQAVLDVGMKPMLCIGETLDEREGGKLEQVLKAQVSGALAGYSAEQLTDLVIAYEPVWAIGTGVVATDEQAQEAHALVRGFLRESVGDLADRTRLLYGGSVKPDNAAGLLAKPDIDGALVGGASLKPDSFLGIIRA